MKKKRSTHPSSASHDSETAIRLHAWLSVVRAYQTCEQSIARELKPLGLKMHHFDILLTLLHFGGQTPQELATRTYVVKSHMSGLLREMQATGWLLRVNDRADKRSYQVSLSAAGKKKAIVAKTIQGRAMATMFEPLSPAEIADTFGVMERVTAALNATYRPAESPTATAKLARRERTRETLGKPQIRVPIAR
jgi:DNA-binding MarR family transcriptional regulator